jgi:hypothetical protein
LSTSNILADEDLNITAVIDWDRPSSLPKSCFDSLPLDVGYEGHQFPGSGGPMDHEVLFLKELFYSIWEDLVREKDPEGKLGRARGSGKDSTSAVDWDCSQPLCLDALH